MSISAAYFPSIISYVWDPWLSVPYIRRIQLGNKGHIESITVDDVKACFP